MNTYNCPKCKQKSIYVVVVERNDCVETNIFKCNNKSCNHQVLNIKEL